MIERAVNPLVSIGMPVFNEERYIGTTLAALCAQTYPNLEILISDNASTDDTFSICMQHASKDPRIRIDRAETNQGATANFQKVLDQAKGNYFMWASGHDLVSPNVVAECVALLESNDRACIAFASSSWIGVEGELLPKKSGWTDTRGMDPVARLFTIFWGNMHPVLGLMRIDALRACQPMQNLVGGDLVLLSELALRGDFVHAMRATWSRRELRTEAHHDDKLRRYASSAIGISRSRFERMFPLLELPIALMRVILRSQLPALDKTAMMLALIATLPLRYLVGRRATGR